MSVYCVFQARAKRCMPLPPPSNFHGDSLMTQATPQYETVDTHIVGEHVLLVTLNRPQSGNALNTQMGRDLLDLWTRITEDAGSVRCIVLTGSGQKIFCAGGDLKERNGMTREQWQRQHELFERGYWTLIDLPVPIIAA